MRARGADGDGVIEFGSIEYDRLFSRRLRSGLDAVAFAGAHAALLEIPCMRPVDARGAAVPALPHDVALDYVLTEAQTFDFRSL